MKKSLMSLASLSIAGCLALSPVAYAEEKWVPGSLSDAVSFGKLVAAAQEAGKNTTSIHADLTCNSISLGEQSMDLSNLHLAFDTSCDTNDAGVSLSLLDGDKELVSAVLYVSEDGLKIALPGLTGKTFTVSTEQLLQLAEITEQQAVDTAAALAVNNDEVEAAITELVGKFLVESAEWLDMDVLSETFANAFSPAYVQLASIEEVPAENPYLATIQGEEVEVPGTVLTIPSELFTEALNGVVDFLVDYPETGRFLPYIREFCAISGVPLENAPSDEEIMAALTGSRDDLKKAIAEFGSQIYDVTYTYYTTEDDKVVSRELCIPYGDPESAANITIYLDTDDSMFFQLSSVDDDNEENTLSLSYYSLTNGTEYDTTFTFVVLSGPKDSEDVETVALVASRSYNAADNTFLLGLSLTADNEELSAIGAGTLTQDDSSRVYKLDDISLTYNGAEIANLSSTLAVLFSDDDVVVPVGDEEVALMEVFSNNEMLEALGEEVNENISNIVLSLLGSIAQVSGQRVD